MYLAFVALIQLLQVNFFNTVKPIYNSHLGDRRKWPLKRGGPSREVETRVNVCTDRQKKKNAVVQKWPF